MTFRRWRGGAFVFVISIVLVGCAALPARETQDVRGTIGASDASEVGVCHLTVTTVTGDPVGETAQIVEEGDLFNWPLPAGDYFLVATCDSGRGELEIHVPSPSNDSLVISVS